LYFRPRERKKDIKKLERGARIMSAHTQTNKKKHQREQKKEQAAKVEEVEEVEEVEGVCLEKAVGK
jgi:hypothetical protein